MKNKNHGDGIGILEAVQVLSDIADLDAELEIDHSHINDILLYYNTKPGRSIEWLKEYNSVETVKWIKQVFRVVFDYIRHFYVKEYGSNGQPAALEEIKSMMILVGEAAKKLDRYRGILEEVHLDTITELKEYRQLQEFYRSRLAHKVDENFLGKWIYRFDNAVSKMPAISVLHQKMPVSTNRTYIDLDAAKKDSEYELFFIRKENGQRFFNPRLIRNIKLVSDFDKYIIGNKEKNAWVHLPSWFDQLCYREASQLYRRVEEEINAFFKFGVFYKNQELVEQIERMVTALLMSANRLNQRLYSPVKTCSEYFQDFRNFLREATGNREYVRWQAYPPKNSSKGAFCLYSLIQNLCFELFVNPETLKLLSREVNDLIACSHEMKNHQGDPVAPLSKQLAKDYASMKHLISKYPKGPLSKVLEYIEKEEFISYDPILQGNIPIRLYTVFINGKGADLIRYPSPTSQEFIHKCSVVEEYKSFLRRYAESEKAAHVLFNFQDKTTWKEHSRSQALENLAHSQEFENSLFVITLPKNTDFYHQEGSYGIDNQTDVFIEQCLAQMSDQSAGFSFPPQLEKLYLSGFVKDMMHAIVHVFFEGKNVLSQQQRKNFIEIFYLFLQLKSLEVISPKSFCYCCKDGIDTSLSAGALLFAFLQLLGKEEVSLADKEELNAMLYAIPLIYRERLLLPERFDRMNSVIRQVEEVKRHMGFDAFHAKVKEVFHPFFKTDLFFGVVSAA